MNKLFTLHRYIGYLSTSFGIGFYADTHLLEKKTFEIGKEIDSKGKKWYGMQRHGDINTLAPCYQHCSLEKIIEQKGAFSLSYKGFRC